MLVYDREKPSGDYGVASDRQIKILDLKSGHIGDLRTRDLKPAFLKGPRLTGATIGISENFDSLYMPMYERQAARYFSLFEYSVEHGVGNKALARGSSDTVDWFVDKNGRALVREDFDRDDGRHTVYVYRNGEAKILLDESTASRQIDIVATTPQQDKLIYYTRLPDSDRMTIHTLSLDDGARSEPVFSYDIGRILVDSNRNAIAFGSFDFPDFEYQFLDESAESHFRAIAATLTGGTIEIVAFTDDFDHVVVRFGQNGRAAAYYLLFTRGNSTPLLIAKQQIEVPDEQIVPVDTHEFVAEDGQRVRTWVTTQGDLQTRRHAPLIIISGFPYWLHQYLAGRGYVVVEPDVRFKNYYPTFIPNADRSWGGRSASDINDTAKHFVDQGIADPERICVVGFGAVFGYAALMAAADSPDTYRCVVSLNGHYDLKKVFQEIRSRGTRSLPDVRFFETLFGVDSSDNKSLEDRSPLQQINANFAPALVIYFSKDDKLFEDQAEGAARALERNDSDYALEEIDSSDLRFEYRDTRLDVLRKIANFVQARM
jgi:dipeptidyl aminopeptidase/acylaminoacyl peptidase